MYMTLYVSFLYQAYYCYGGGILCYYLPLRPPEHRCQIIIFGVVRFDSEYVFV